MSLERFAFSQLIRGLKEGWSLPEEVLQTGIATAAAITRSAAASPRDKARAAELLISAAFRQKQHLVDVARVEHDIMAAEAQNAAAAVVEAALNDILSPPAPIASGDQATTTPGRSKPSPKARRAKRA